MPARRKARPRVIGDVSIYPIGFGSSLGEYVRAAYLAMGTVRGVRLAPSAMSTVLEAPSLDHVLLAVKRAHAALIRLGAPRVAINLRIDHRLDKPETIEYKLARIRGRP